MRLIHPDKNQLFTQIFFFFFFAKCCQKSSYVVNWPPPEQLGAHFKILWELDTLKTNTKQIRLCTHISKELNVRVGEYGQSSESQNGCSFKIIFRLLSLHNGYWYMWSLLCFYSWIAVDTLDIFLEKLEFFKLLDFKFLLLKMQIIMSMGFTQALTLPSFLSLDKN